MWLVNAGTAFVILLHEVTISVRVCAHVEWIGCPVSLHSMSCSWSYRLECSLKSVKELRFKPTYYICLIDSRRWCTCHLWPILSSYHLWTILVYWQVALGDCIFYTNYSRILKFCVWFYFCLKEAWNHNSSTLITQLYRDLCRVLQRVLLGFEFQLMDHVYKFY